MWVSGLPDMNLMSEITFLKKKEVNVKIIAIGKLRKASRFLWIEPLDNMLCSSFI